MNYLKKSKRLIAALVAVTFFYLINISAMPLKAEGNPTAPSGPASVSASNDGPGSIEQSTYATHKSKKSPIVLIIIAVVAAGAIAAVLILVVFKTKYDITGSWKISHHITWISDGHIQNYDYNFTFTGTKESGTFLNTSRSFTGIYTVTDKKKVHFEYDDYVDTFDGQFDGKDKMSGTLVSGNFYTGTWTATRTATAAVNPPIFIQKDTNTSAKTSVEKR